MRKRMGALGPSTLAAWFLVAACASEEAPTPGTSTEASVREIVIETSDFAFAGPQEMVAGPVRIRMVNKGQELHHVTLVRIPATGSLDHLATETSDVGLMDARYEAFGGPNAVGPGGESVVEVHLEPGSYGLICLIPSPDMVPHFKKGMVAAFTVVDGEEATTAAAVPADADLTLSLAEYGFAWESPPTAGRHRIKVENRGMEAHEVFIARLAPGKTAHDLLTWIEAPEGPPPGEALGGVGFMKTGLSNIMEVELTPGRYALYCFVPTVDGVPHFVHGMIQEFDVAG